MKLKKRIFALMLAVFTMFALSTTAFAQDVTVDTGNGSITVTDTTVDETYTLYKLFDAGISADGKAVTYTTDKADLGAGSTWFNSKAIGGGKYEITAKESAGASVLTDTVLKSAEFKAWALSFGTKVKDVKATDTEIKFTKVAYGYYAITSTLQNAAGTSAISITSATPNGKIYDKNPVPEHKGKWIVLNKGQNTENQVKYNTAEMSPNAPIDFRLITKTTNYDGADKNVEFGYRDILPAGMTFKNGTVTVTVGGETINEATTGTKRYSITYYTDEAMKNAIAGPIDQTKLNTARAFKVTIPWTTDGTADGDSIYKNNSLFVIDYQAYLDPAKADQIVSNGDPNINTGKPYWIPLTPGTPDPPKVEKEAPEDTTRTYETELEVFKYTMDNQQRKALEGAEFTLQRVDGGVVGKTVIQTSGTRFVVDVNGTHWKLKDGKYTTTDPSTPGVSAGNYDSTTTKYRKETFTEVQNENTTGTTVKGYVNADGKILFRGLYEGTYKLVETVVPDGYNKAADIEFTITFDGTNFATTNANVTYEKIDGKTIFRTSVENKAGTTLPSTGGIGTTMFYIFGAILVLGAGILLFVNKRMKRQSK